MTKKTEVAVGPIGKLRQKIAKVNEKINKKSEKSKGWRIFFIFLRALLMMGWVYAMMMAAQWVIAYIMIWILPQESLQTNVVNAVYQGIVFAICLLLVIVIPWKVLHVKTTRDEMGLRGAPTWTDILLAPVVFIAVLFLAGFLTNILMALLPGVDWEQAQDVGFRNLYNTGDFIVAFICLVILAPVCEEAIFRGWLYGKMRARMPAFPAIILVSLLFGIMHGQLNVGVTVFAMSIGMCIQRELTGTIWSGVLVHMIKNAIAFYLLFVAA